MLRLEFHCHTIASPDSLVAPADLVRICREIGIDRVVITDHNSIQGALLAQEIDPELVVVGEEIRTTRGELLCAYVREEIPSGLEPTEALHRLKEQGAFISVSHPFDPSRSPWYSDGLDDIRQHIDAIEIFNSRTFPRRANAKARAYAEESSLPGTVGSDAHTLGELGLATMLVPDFRGPHELREAILEARYELRPSGLLARFGSRYASLRKRLGA